MQLPNYLPLETLLTYRDELKNRLLDQIDLINEIQNSGFTQHGNLHTSETLAQADQAAEQKNYTEATQNHPFTNKEDLKESKDILQGELAKLENLDIVLAVVGTMKAGKSTTINAIVGREILPSRNRPMTTLPTLIRHTPEQNHPELTFDSTAINSFAQNIQKLLRDYPACKNNPEISANPSLQKLLHTIEKSENREIFQNHYHGEAEIFAFLESLNDMVRLSEMLGRSATDNGIAPDHFAFPYAQYRNLDSLPLITVAFSNLKDQEHLPGRLTLLDTPGPNEYGQNHLTQMLNEQLRRSSAVLLILDYTQLKSNAEAGVRAQLAQLPHIDEKRLFALVNKFDQYTRNSDNVEETQDMIYGDLLKDKILHENIFVVSAQKAFLAQRMAAEIDRTGNKPDYQRNSWIADFAHSIYPDYDKEEAEEEWASADIANIMRSIERMKKSSRISLPVDKIILQTRHEAPILAIDSALQQVWANFENIDLVLQTHRMVLGADEESMKKLESTIENMRDKMNLLSKLKVECSHEIQNIITESRQETLRHMTELTKQTKYAANKLLDNIEQPKEKKKQLISSIVKSLKEKLPEKITENTKNHTIEFSSEKERDKFYEKIREIYQIIRETNEIEANQILRETINILNENISLTNKKCEEIFYEATTEIKNAFKSENNKMIHDHLEEDFDLKITLPKNNNIEFVKNIYIDYQRSMKPHYKKRRVESEGFLWGAVRLITFNNYGYDEEEYISGYTDSREQVLETMINDIEERILLPTTKTIEETSVKLSEDILSHLENIKTKIEKIANLISFSIAEKNKEKMDPQELETRKQKILFMEKSSKLIKDDIKNVFEDFWLQDKTA